MNDLVRLVGVGFIGGMLALAVKKERSEIALLIALATSVILLISVTEKIGGIINDMLILIESCGVDIKYFSLALKAVGIAYISQFAAELLRDCGEGAIASKVETVGKIFILSLVMPVMASFLELCVKVVSTI